MPAAETIDEALLRRWPLPLAGAGGKDERGRVFVVAGAPQMPGAAVLTATAALRAGAGKLQIGTVRSVAAHVATAVPESLTVALDELPSGGIAPRCADTVAAYANRANALVIGPGMVDERLVVLLMVSLAEQLRTPAVVDAAALACFSERPEAFAHLGALLVLTPHAGEMASMLERPRETIEADPQAHALEAARRFGAVVALKGARTFIADPGGALYCNVRGDVGLATSGSGDTLAGIVGGILARGATPLQAAVWGVFVHARAGETLSQRMGIGFLARELLAEIPPLLRDLSV